MNNNKSEEINNVNYTSSYFDDIIKPFDVNLNTYLTDEKFKICFY